MQPKTILAIVNGQTDMERVLAVAAPLSRRFGAQLGAIHAEALPMPTASPMGFPDTGMLEASITVARDNSRQLKAAFDASPYASTVSWKNAEGFSGDSTRSVARAARAADLVVVQQADPDGAVPFPSGETLVFETGRPVLFVPFSGTVDTRFRKAVVAWNGSAEAARAAFDALPFLVEADAVSILCVDPRSEPGDPDELAGADIAEALRRHGVKATVVTEVSAGLSAGATIENHLAGSGADLLVMGAYSQSWLKEFFFGGATRTLLSSMPVATLMSR